MGDAEELSMHKLPTLECAETVTTTKIAPESKTAAEEPGHLVASTDPASLHAPTTTLDSSDVPTVIDATPNVQRNVWFDSADFHFDSDISKWLTHHNTARVLVTGRTGVGKSYLINTFGLTGEQNAPTAIGLKPATKDVIEYECEKYILRSKTVTSNAVTLYLCDSPGFEPHVHWTNTLKKIKEYFKREKPDLVYFCVRIDERLVQEDRDAMTNLTRAFGSEIWRNTMIVLTRANQLPDDRFQASLEDMTEYLQKHLTRGSSAAIRPTGPSVSKQVVKDIPIIPAGGIDNLEQIFKGTNDPWITSLLRHSLNRCSTTGGPAFLKANWLTYTLHLKQTIIYRLMAEMKRKIEWKQVPPHS